MERSRKRLRLDDDAVAEPSPSALPAGADGGSVGSGGADVSDAHPVDSTGNAAEASDAEEIGTGASTLNSYRSFSVRVDVGKVRLPTLKVRPMRENEAPVKSFKTLFDSGNYGAAGSYISVALDPKCSVTTAAVKKAWKDARDQNGSVLHLTGMQNVSVVLVDGAHRLYALRSASIPIVLARFWYRKDNRRFLVRDFLSVGNNLNGFDAIGVRTTPFHRVYTFTSVLRDACDVSTDIGSADYEGTEKKLVTALRTETDANNLRKLIDFRGVSDTLKRSQCIKYCKVAVGLHPFPEFEEELEKLMGEGLSLTLASIPDLWKANSLRQLRFFVRTATTLHRAEELPLKKTPLFLKKLSDFWGLVVATFEGHGLGVEEGFKLRCKGAHRDSDYHSDVWTRVLEWTGAWTKEDWEPPVNWGSSQQRVLKLLRTKTEWTSGLDGCSPEPPATPAAQSNKESEDANRGGSHRARPAPHPRLDSTAETSRSRISASRTSPLSTATGRPIPRRSSTRLQSRKSYLDWSEKTVSDEISEEAEPKNMAEEPEARPDERRVAPEVEEDDEAGVAKQAKEPEPWELEANLTPDGDRRADKEGFALTHAWKDGFRYERPKPRSSGCLSLRPERDDEIEGDDERWWVFKLPGMSKVRLYEDRYSNIVRTNPAWRLSALPRDDAVDWRLKNDAAVPSDWDEDLNVEALLRSLGFRPPHQAFFTLGRKDFLSIRGSVFAFCMQRMIPPNAWIGVKNDATLQNAAEWWFSCQRALLDAQGYLVVKGFVKREVRGPWVVHFDAVDWDTSDIVELFQYFQQLVPDENARMTELFGKCWTRIRNTEVHADAFSDADVRWQTSAFATNSHLEDSARVKHLKARCKIEVAVWILIHYLRLESETFDRKETSLRPPHLYATDSGSRFLASGTQCSEQIAHTDFIHSGNVQAGEYPQRWKYPGYFTIQTGEDGGALWVLKGSHEFIFLDKKETERLAEIIGMTLMEISPWSLFIGRSDLVHAGCGKKTYQGKRCLRMHDYVLREGLPFADTIHERPHWKHLS